MKSAFRLSRGTTPGAHKADRAAQSPRWLAAALGFGVGALVTVPALAPAAWLSEAVQTLSEGRIQLPDARGSVWNGSSGWKLTGGAGSADGLALPGRLEWTLRPSWNGLSLILHSSCCTTQPIRLEAAAGWQTASVRVVAARGTSVETTSSRWPANLLSGLGAPWNTLQPEGSLELTTQGLTATYADGRLLLGGQAVITAHDMSSRLSTIRPMGTYRVQVTGGNPVTVNVSTLQGALQFTGQGQWIGSRLRFSGEASAEPQSEDALSNLLNIIGRRHGTRSLITLG